MGAHVSWTEPCNACQVAELSGRVSALQMSLQLSAMREFELLGTGEDKPNPLLLERLRACCLVIDVLGFKVSMQCSLHCEAVKRFHGHCQSPAWSSNILLCLAALPCTAMHVGHSC